jgi:Glutaredoxin
MKIMMVEAHSSIAVLFRRVLLRLLLMNTVLTVMITHQSGDTNTCVVTSFTLPVVQHQQPIVSNRNVPFRRTSSTSLQVFNFLNEGKKALVKNMAGEYDTVQIRNRINSLIQDNTVLMLSFETCPYCVKAKAILDEKNAKYVT